MDFLYFIIYFEKWILYTVFSYWCLKYVEDLTRNLILLQKMLFVLQDWGWLDFQLTLYCCKILTLWKITFCVADDHLSIQVDESGWAWLVHKERLIIWKIGQSPVAKVNERLRRKMCTFELVGQVTQLCCFKSRLPDNLKFASSTDSSIW